MPSTAAHRLVETLITNDVTHVFCVPGESYLAVLDALVDYRNRIQVITCRHEAGAANMALAHGKLTGRPGICFVTRGPGATHASIAVHTAAQDSAPFILFIGQIARGDRGREAFQEVDYSAVFGSMTKRVEELDDATRTVEVVSRAFATAQQGRMGPVVVSLPEDVLVEDAGDRIPARVTHTPSALDATVAHSIALRLQSAARPLLLLGGSGWTPTALAQLTTWARTMDLPIVLSWRRKDLIDNSHSCYIGDLNIRPTPSLTERFKACDLLIAIGTRLGDINTTGYTMFTEADTAAKLVHICSGAEELNSVWHPAIATIASVTSVALTLSTIKVERRWTDWCQSARTDYERTLTPVKSIGAVNLSEVFAHMNDVLPHDVILCNGAGNYAAWPARFFKFRHFPSQLAPTSGAMGFGFPAAIGAKLAFPQREVIAIAGDGCFLMTGQELATAIQHDIRIVTIVIDNSSYGTIRMHQERSYPRRVSATDIRNPDFAAFARSFGAWAATVESTAEFPQAFADARAAGKPALIHIKTDVRDILPGQTLPT
jgi:acetolactate synthase-1/2/3 large subunit